MLLAHAGWQVTVYEAHATVGGRTRQLEVGPYRFDCGPTFFMMPWVLEEIFEATGRKLADYAELRRLDPMYRLLIGQPTGDPVVIDTTQDIARMSRQLSAIEPSDGPAFERFIRDNRRKLEVMTPLLRRPIRGLRDLFSLDAMRAGPALRPWQSLYDHLKGYFRHEGVRLAMSFQSKYLGMSPFECPELFSILPFIEYEYGIWHPIGGCSALMRAMADACTEMGVEVRCGEPVEQVLFQGKRASGVRVAGRHERHDHVVVNADAAWALKNLVPSEVRPRALKDDALDAKRFSCSTFMMYLGVEGTVDLPHHTIYTSRSYVSNLQDISRNGTLSDDPSTATRRASTRPWPRPGTRRCTCWCPRRTTRRANATSTGTGRGASSVSERCASSRTCSASETSARASAPSTSSRPPTGSPSASRTAPPSTWPTTWARCSTVARTIGCRAWTTCGSSAAARTRGADSRSSSCRPRSPRD
jgi:phytoene desaturase